MQPLIQTASLADPTPYPIRLCPPSAKQEKSLSQLERCGLRFERHTVRILTPQEGAYVRKGFTKGIKHQHWSIARSILRLEVEMEHGDLTRRQRQELYRNRRQQLESMDLHHVIQIMTCPISLSPHTTWEHTLKWWRREAHRRVVPTEKKLHHLIHVVQDRQIIERFGTQSMALERKSGAFQGELDIAVLRGSIWQPIPAVKSNVAETGIVLPLRPQPTVQTQTTSLVRN